MFLEILVWQWVLRIQMATWGRLVIYLISEQATMPSRDLKPFYRAKHLRVLLPLLRASSIRHFLGDKVLHDLIPKERCLRVISWGCYKNVDELPSFIGNSTHLHFLKLLCTSVTRLPDCTCILHNLQTLMLLCCGSLKELPVNLRRPITLRYLSIGEDKFEKASFSNKKLNKSLEIEDLH